MATAHGAGLMVLPVVMTMGEGGPMCHTAGASSDVERERGADRHARARRRLSRDHRPVAVVVFEKLGVGIVRRAWINLDIIWAGALIVAGLLTVVRDLISFLLCSSFFLSYG